MEKIICTAVVVFALFATASACPSLPEGQKIDWTKMYGKVWYTTHAILSPVVRILPCFAVSDFNDPFASGRAAVVTLSHDRTGEDKKSLIAHVHPRDNNTYVWQIPGIKKYIRQNGDIPEVLRKAAVKQARDMTSDPTVFFTDYENYLALVMCDNKGGRNIWARFQDPNPSHVMVEELVSVLKDSEVETEELKKIACDAWEK